MAKKDLEVKWSSDHQKVIDGFAKIIAKNEQAISKLKQTNREAKKAKKGVAGVGDAARNTAASIKSWVAGFAGIEGVRRVLGAIIAEMKEADRLRKGMHETALSVEQLSLKMAHLRGDVTRGGIAAVGRDIEDIAKRTHIGLDVAAKALFYSESAMGAGTTAAKAAAMAIGKFAAPAGLAPEETTLIPKMFDIWNASTKKRQMQMLNQLRAATAASIAETGEFIQPFVTPMTMAKMMGFTYPQALAQMVSAIQTTGTVEKAGTAMKTAMQIARGRTQKALEFYGEEAGKKGIDFGKLPATQRYEFVARLFQESVKQGPEAMDRFVTMVGGKGFQFIQQMFGEAGRRKYAEVLPTIEAAAGAGAVERMARQYRGTLIAGKVGREIRGQMAETRTGIEREPQIIFKEVTRKIADQAKAMTSGFVDYMKFGLTPEGWKAEKAGRMLIRENLALAIEKEKEGSKKREYLTQLFREPYKKYMPSIYPDYLKRVYGATEGLGLIGKYGRLTDISTMQKLMPEWTALQEKGFHITDREKQEQLLTGELRPEHYMKGLRNYFGLGEGAGAQGVPSEEMKKHTEALSKNTQALEKLTQRIPVGSNVDRGDVD